MAALKVKLAGDDNHEVNYCPICEGVIDWIGDGYGRFYPECRDCGHAPDAEDITTD